MYMPVLCKIYLAIYPCTSDHSGRSLTQKRHLYQQPETEPNKNLNGTLGKKRAMILVNISNTTGEQ